MRTPRLPVCLIVVVLVSLAGCWHSGTATSPPGGGPAGGGPAEAAPAEPTPPECDAGLCDGLAQAVFDSTVRIRNRSGMGSGSVVADLGDSYEVETNYHVAGRTGTANIIDIWVGGDLVASRPTATVQSWFQDGKSKDIATLRLQKSELGGPLAVVETAPPGYSERLNIGDMVFTVGCQSGQWPRARCGNILRVDRGLIWYEPESIPGDSGSGVYRRDPDSGRWYCVGRTAWAIQERGRWVGLAMDSDRVRAIREGRVSEGWDLPEGAVPIETVPPDPDDPIGLPMDAIRLDLMPHGPQIVRTADSATPDSIVRDDPQPIETGVRSWGAAPRDDSTPGVLRRLLDGHELRMTGEVRAATIRAAGPIREAIASAVRLVGIAIAASTAFILIAGWLYIRGRL